MSVNFNPGIPTNPGIFLNGMQDAGNILGTKNQQRADKNLTFSETDQKAPITPSTPDIEPPDPESFSAEQLEEIQKKIADAFNFTPEEQALFDAAFKETIEKFMSSKSNNVNPDEADGTTKTDEADDANKTNETDDTNKTNEADDTNKTNEADDTNKTNETDDTNKTNETDGTPKTDEADDTNKTNETDDTNKTDETDDTNKTDETPETQKAKQTTPPKAQTTKLIFDLYAMLALLTECMQKMKDAQREQRKSEMESMANSIQQQADSQRSAAMTGMIAGGIICALQVGAAAYSAYKTVSNTVSDSSIANQYGVNQAATELGHAQTELNNSVDALKTFNTEHPIPEEGAAPEAQEITQQRAELQQHVDQAKADLMAKKISFESKVTEMKNSDEFRALEKSQAKVKAFSDITMAVGNLGQTLIRGGMDIQQANATAEGAGQKKAEEQLAQTKDLMESFQDVINKMLQLLQAVLQAENQSMNDAIHA